MYLKVLAGVSSATILANEAELVLIGFFLGQENEEEELRLFGFSREFPEFSLKKQANCVAIWCLYNVYVRSIEQVG